MLNEMMYVRRNFRYAFISIGRDLAKLRADPRYELPFRAFGCKSDFRIEALEFAQNRCK